MRLTITILFLSHEIVASTWETRLNNFHFLSSDTLRYPPTSTVFGAQNVIKLIWPILNTHNNTMHVIIIRLREVGRARR